MLPKTLKYATTDFQKRPTNGHQLILVFLCFFTIGYGFVNVAVNSALLIIVFVALELISKLLNFLIYHFDREKPFQKKFDVKMLTSHLCDFNPWTIGVTVMALCILLLNKDYEGFIGIDRGICFCIAFLLTKVLNIQECEYDRGLWIEKYSKGLDCGSYMAVQFFYGYLKIMLPNKGDENMGIKEAMVKYEDVHHVIIPVKKLFILAPSTLYSPPDLHDMTYLNDIHLEACSTLEPIRRDMAGVKNRIYKNSVYKIHKRDGSRPTYVVAEGASALKTLFEGISYSTKFQKYYRAHTHDILVQFYCTLRDLINNDLECKDLCEVIYYDDTKEKINVAKLLLERIEFHLSQPNN